jgi:hypothetical protein
MGLFISNRLTAKQRAILEKYDYCGSYDLTVEQAAVIIDELFEEQRLMDKDAGLDDDQYGYWD